MKYNNFQVIICLSLITALSLSSCKTGTEQPNIVMFIADDLSFEDLGCHGHSIVKTPNVDRMAAEGLSLTRMYVTTAMCAPSRSALFTGLYPHRNGCHMNHGRVRDSILSLPHYLVPLKAYQAS